MPRKAKETDLSRLKSLAHSLLMLDIQPTKMSPIVVKHPFTDSALVGLRNNQGDVKIVNLLEDPKALHRWRESYAQQIDETDTAFGLFLMITNPYKLAFLKYAAPDLSKQNLALFLSHAWTITESPNSDPNLNQKELLSMFRSVEPQMLMDGEEYAIFQGLDDVMTVYRGVTSYNAKNVKALSWTLDRDVAEWFAHRYGEDGTVYEARIGKEHILAVFTSRNESEVIVDPAQLMELARVQEPQDEFEMKMQ